MRAHTRHGLLCGPEARKRRAHARKARYRRHWQPPCPRQQPHKRVGPMAGLGAFEWSHLRRAPERYVRCSRDERRVGSAIRGDRGAGGQLCTSTTTAHAAAPVAPYAAAASYAGYAASTAARTAATASDNTTPDMIRTYIRPPTKTGPCISRAACLSCQSPC